MGDDNVDKPQQATAAQLARRKILSAKGRGTPRGSRSGSPATGLGGGVGGATGGGQSNPFQTFQPPPSANGFNFSVPGSTPAPSFGQQPAQQNGGFNFGGQANGSQGFGGFGNSQASNTQNSGNAGFSFGSNTPPPQVNGFNATNSFFNQSQPNSATTPSSSFTFGPTQSQGQEPAKTNGGLFGGQQSQQANGSTPSFSFGQSQPEKPATPSTPAFSFGQSQANGEKPAATGLFGAAPTTTAPLQANGTTAGLFGSTPTATAGSKPGDSIFGSATKPAEDSSTAPKPVFSFGKPAEKLAEQSADTPKPANPFAGFNKPAETSTPKPAAFHFGQPAQTSAEPPKSTPFTGLFHNQKHAEAEKTPEPAKQNAAPAAANPFAGFGQPKKPEAAFNFSNTANQAQETPKQNIFGASSQPIQTQPSSTPGFSFGTSHQDDTSMVTPTATPHKPSAFGTQDKAPAETAAPATASRSLFDRSAGETPASAAKPAFSFGATGGTMASQNQETPQPNPSRSLFDRITQRESEAPSTIQKPAADMFTAAAAQTPATPTAPPSFKFTAPTPQPAQPPMQSGRPATSARDVLSSKSATSGDKLKSLNQGLLAQLMSQDTSKDWTPVLQFYIRKVAEVIGGNLAGTAETRTKSTSAAKPATPNIFATMQTATPSTPAPMKQPPSNIFAKASQPPATAPVNRKRSADEPAEAPATEKRSKSSESAVSYPKLPETASNTAKLFASTLERSNSGERHFGPPQDLLAKAREQNAEKEASSVSSGSVFKPSTTFSWGSAAATPTPPPEKETEKPKETAKFGFAPSAPADHRSPTKPSAAAGPPSFTAPAAPGGFLSAFGKKAEEGLEKAKKKRMDEDYDSEEEDRESWEKRDREEQERKRKAIEEAAKKGSGFKVGSISCGSGAASATSTTGFKFHLPGAAACENEKNTSAEDAGMGKSLFNRMTPADKPATSPGSNTPNLFATQPTDKPASSGSSLFNFGASKPAEMDKDASAPSSTASNTQSIFASQTIGKPMTSGFSFGASKPADADKDKTEAEKEQGSGNHTWKPNTPIKFGNGAAPTAASTTPAAPPPTNPFAGLFGNKSAATPAADGSNKLAPPAPVGFSFGGMTPKGISSDVSRATTPGLTTDGEASNAGDGDESAAQKDEQIEDMTALLPSELEIEEVLLETPMAKAMKLATPSSGGPSSWMEKGKGRLYVLKNKESGKVRVLMKIPPLGKVAMNYGVLKGMEYKQTKPGGKVIEAVFIDHLDSNKEAASKPTRFTVQFREADLAGLAAKVLTEGRPQ